MRPFALYRFPFERHFTLISGKERRFHSLVSLNGAEGFILSKFNGEEGVLIESESYSTGLVDELPDGERIKYAYAESCKNERDEYDSVFEVFYNAIEGGEFEKVVLSRCHKLRLSSQVSEAYLQGLFKRACAKYRSAFVYVLSTAQNGVWFGCSPELLVEGGEGSFHSVALAGTMPSGEGEWSEKNKREQSFVTGFVRTVLSRFSHDVKESEPYSAEAGGIKHIKTDFSFSLTDDRSVLEVASALHPTPAVCGLERDAARKFIERNEGYDRSCYAGITGIVGNDTHLYVNLRCVNFNSGEALLYAGGGLVKGSNAADEWCETESKLQTIISII